MATTMHPRIVELEGRLDVSRKVLRDAIHQIPPELQASSPGDGRWSVAQVLEHLALIDRMLASLIGELLGAAKLEGVGPDPEREPILPTIDLSVVLDRSRRVQARPTALPRQGLTSHQAWVEVENSRRELVAVVQLGHEVNLTTIEHPHPLFGPLNGYQWIAFVAVHEERHAAQVREIGTELSAVS